MRDRDKVIAASLEKQLDEFSNKEMQLLGIRHQDNKEVLLEQLVDSIRRIKYVQVVRQRRLSPLRVDSSSDLFDPIKAAIIHQQNGDIEEASWLIFLSTHFGKSGKDGWHLTKDFYGALGQGFTWSWKQASYNPDAVIDWLAKNYPEFAKNGYRFGNHRKYESMNPNKKAFTGMVLKSYIAWVQNNNSHAQLFQNAQNAAAGDPKLAFKILYKSMSSVFRFGRMGKFDYLTMIGKVGISAIDADSTYMGQATGPYDGAKLLFLGRVDIEENRKRLDEYIKKLDAYLNVGMQVLEDALCNWQKSPSRYLHFRG